METLTEPGSGGRTRAAPSNLHEHVATTRAPEGGLIDTRVNAIAPSNAPIHILLIDPHPFDRAFTLAGLKAADACTVEAADDIDALSIGGTPHVVLLQQEGTTGRVEGLAKQLGRVTRRWPNALTVVISQEGDDGRLRSSLQVGAHGVLTSSADPQAWISSIKLIASGEAVYPRGVIKIIRTLLNTRDDKHTADDAPLADERFQQLTPRQRDVLRLLAVGYSNHKIAGLLNISISTVKVHVRAIMMQVGVANRTQIVASYIGGQVA